MPGTAGDFVMTKLFHGIDLVDFGRIEKMAAEHGDHFLDRIFTPAEQGYAKSNKNSTEKLAGRFAAKEAVMKLIGTGWRGKIAWTDIEVTNDLKGQPAVTISGEVKRIADELGIDQIAISITHTADFAIASVVALTNEDE